MSIPLSELLLNLEVILMRPWVLGCLIIPLLFPTVIFWRHAVTTTNSMPVRHAKAIKFPLRYLTGNVNWVILTLLVFSASLPISVTPQTLQIHAEHVIVLDISPSMQQYTKHVTQSSYGRYIDLAKANIAQQLRQANTLFSLVVFSDHAIALAPLTHDTIAVHDILELAQIEASNAVTSIGQGLQLGKEMLSSSNHSEQISRRIILYSDGENNADINQLIEVGKQIEQANIELIVNLFAPIKVAHRRLIQTHLPNANFVHETEFIAADTTASNIDLPAGKITHYFPFALLLAFALILWQWAISIYRLKSPHNISSGGLVDNDD